MNCMPSKPEAANPAIASGFQSVHRWRGVADPERSALARLLKIAPTFLTLILLLTACAHRDKQLSDTDVGQRLIGSWKVQVIDPDGSSDTKGTFTVAADNSYRSELVTSVSNQMR